MSIVNGRPSRTAAIARQRERERIASMTPVQRAIRALELGERRRYLAEIARRSRAAAG